MTIDALVPLLFLIAAAFGLVAFAHVRIDRLEKRLNEHVAPPAEPNRED